MPSGGGGGEGAGGGAELFSEGWLKNLERSLRAVGERAGSPGAAQGDGEETGRRRLALGQVVTGVPATSGGGRGGDGGVVRYLIVIGEGEPEVRRGSTEGADVVLVTDYDAARALAGGEVEVGALLASGRIKVHGDANALVEAQDLIAALAPRRG